jgi:hypothetical protein
VDRHRFDTDPDRHQNGNSDQDRHQNDPDPQHWHLNHYEQMCAVPTIIAMPIQIGIKTMLIHNTDIWIIMSKCVPTILGPVLLK